MKTKIFEFLEEFTHLNINKILNDGLIFDYLNICLYFNMLLKLKKFFAFVKNF